ncbi:MAG: MFS transporter [Acidobacteriota bacterium]
MRPDDNGPQTSRWHGLDRNVLAASIAVFLLFLGEELWKKFLPSYLQALGAGAVTIGLFGSTRDFFDAIYQYPGGWLADRLGRRRAFLLFIGLASLGYLIYLVSPSWEFVFVGLAFVMAWSSMASPAVFAIIGDALPRERRALGFTIQSFLKRIPMAVGPIIGGLLIARLDVVRGVRTGLMITLGLAILTVFVARTINIEIVTGMSVNMAGVWRSFHRSLKRLLISDIIIRICEGLADVFVILYVTNVLGYSTTQYGLLVAVQMATSMVVYLPAGRLADRVGRKPFVITTFICFALFPIAITLASSVALLVVAFIIGGLREIGEPSRKALIVDLAEPSLRARTVGLYYLVRSLTIAPAAAIGGLLWNIAPAWPFRTAGIIGLIGVVVFALTVDEQGAG